ncbi:MAG: hypothetical protein HY680_00795 [Chloroflexi bacterium]|nr:hypothetical protein [Chloroflexota bacterium]
MVQSVDGSPFITLHHVRPVWQNGTIRKFVTTVSVGRLGDLLEQELIWVDYDYQRGIKITWDSEGNEKKREPNVDWGRVDEITQALLNGTLFGGSLTWNLRESEVKFEYDETHEELRILGGRPTIPDSNHRHQAILKACKLVEVTGMSFDLNYEFPLLVEVLPLDGERNLFKEYNQLGRPANPTRSKWIDQADLHNKLASRVMEDSGLRGHVEVVRNTISTNSPMVVTFNTLAKGVSEAFPDLDEMNFQAYRKFLCEFVDYLAKVRPETGYLPLSRRKGVRESSIGDSGLVFGAYFRLAGNLFIAKDWQSRLARLADKYSCTDPADGGIWKGDLMGRSNPLWRDTVLRLNPKSGNRQIANRTETRAFVYDKLKSMVGV